MTISDGWHDRAFRSVALGWLLTVMILFTVIGARTPEAGTETGLNREAAEGSTTSTATTSTSTTTNAPLRPSAVPTTATSMKTSTEASAQPDVATPLAAAFFPAGLDSLSGTYVSALNSCGEPGLFIGDLLVTSPGCAAKFADARHRIVLLEASVEAVVLSQEMTAALTGDAQTQPLVESDPDRLRLESPQVFLHSEATSAANVTPEGLRSHNLCSRDDCYLLYGTGPIIGLALSAIARDGTDCDTRIADFLAAVGSEQTVTCDPREEERVVLDAEGCIPYEFSQGLGVIVFVNRESAPIAEVPATGVGSVCLEADASPDGFRRRRVAFWPESANDERGTGAGPERRGGTG